jgi:hypothetical protein
MGGKLRVFKRIRRFFSGFFQGTKLFLMMEDSTGDRHAGSGWIVSLSPFARPKGPIRTWSGTWLFKGVKMRRIPDY